MGNNSVPKFIFRLSRFPAYRGSVLGRFYCIIIASGWLFKNKSLTMHGNKNAKLNNAVFVTQYGQLAAAGFRRPFG